MNTPELKEFIRWHSNLFWYIPEAKKENPGIKIVLEFIFNYGTIEDVKELMRITLGGRTGQNFLFSQGQTTVKLFS